MTLTQSQASVDSSNTVSLPIAIIGSDDLNGVTGSFYWQNTHQPDGQPNGRGGGAFFNCPAGFKPPSSNPCTAIPTVRVYADGVKADAGYNQNATDPTTHATVACPINCTAIGAPTVDPYNGRWSTYESCSATGNPASDAGGVAPGTWLGPDKKPITPAPPPVPQPPVDNPAPPKQCGGGSCYDPKNDQYCATSGGQQFCVSGAAARSNAGGCVSSGDATLCAGASTAPKPDPSKVSDPPSQIASSDKTTQATPSGAPVTVTTNVYNTAPGASTSGQKPGDNGPAPASSVPASSSSSGKGTGSYGGGGDCNTPPVCSGDAVLCGASRSQWATTCQLHTDLAGDGTGQSKFDALSNKYSIGDVTLNTGTGNTVGDAANNGSYDHTGFGFDSQCPMNDLVVPVLSNSFSIPFSKGCIIGPWVRGILIAFSLFAAARITAGSNR